jgi:uncharacterized protein YbaR (Trm112 family)
MERGLLDDLVCPYCNGHFRVASEAESENDRLNYALVECRCFKFPIVDGVLLLSLAKGYGGAEEELQPYVPLQVASISFLERGETQGLRAWIRQHIPLANAFLDGSTDSYLHFRSKMIRELERAKNAYLSRQGRYGSVGTAGQAPVRKFTRNFYHVIRSLSNRLAQNEMETLADFYAGRFFAPRTNVLAMQLEWLPMRGRILSLCCGHGVFENSLAASGSLCKIVSIDGQFINLLATRHYANPGGNYICHDLQMLSRFEINTSTVSSLRPACPRFRHNARSSRSPFESPGT